jgi:hypothetical protein
MLCSQSAYSWRWSPILSPGDTPPLSKCVARVRTCLCRALFSRAVFSLVAERGWCAWLGFGLPVWLILRGVGLATPAPARNSTPNLLVFQCCARVCRRCVSVAAWGIHHVRGQVCERTYLEAGGCVCVCVCVPRLCVPPSFVYPSPISVGECRRWHL